MVEVYSATVAQRRVPYPDGVRGMTRPIHALGRRLRFVIAETLAGGLFSIGYLLWGTRGFSRWRGELDETLEAVLPKSPSDPAARLLYLGVGGTGAFEGCMYALTRPLLPKRPEIAGTIFSWAFSLAVVYGGTRIKKRFGQPVPPLSTHARGSFNVTTVMDVRFHVLLGTVLALTERLSR
jgi:hypothetical protein